MEGEMKKRVFKQKRQSGRDRARMPGDARRRIGKGAGRALALAAAFCLMAGTASGIFIPVYGQESAPATELLEKKTVVTDIFHRHVGNAGTQGGCYSVAIPHIHVGDPAAGSGCYVLPGKLHDHEGSGETGGGCYGLAIPHETHTDDCYVEETHNHGGDCYGGNCTMTYSNLRLRETFTDNCPGHGSTTFERSDVTESHSDCELGVIESVIEYCQICRYMPSRSHPFVNCGKQEGTIKVLACNKTVERYETTCGFAQGQPETWLPGCGLDADGYALGCNLTEDTPCGRLILTSQPQEEGKRVTVTARVEDLGGNLILGDEPYLWQDQNGAVLGKGDRLQVEENGNYSVTVSLKNKDVDESGLRSSIQIDGINGDAPDTSPAISPSPSPQTTPDATPAPEKDPSSPPEPSQAPQGTPDPSEEPAGPADTGGGEEGGDGDDTPQEPVQTPHGQNPDEEKQEREQGQEETKSNPPSAAGNRRRNGREQNAQKPEISPTPSAVPKASPEKVTGKVAARENQTAGEESGKIPQEVKRRGFFRSAAARVITLTVSTALLLGGLLCLLVWLMCSVGVYNDNGEGRMLYLGRCMVRKREEEYSIVITDAMTEKSCTNRYCIKPGLFRFGKDQDQELTVWRETKKAVALLSREMIVIL